MGTLEILNRKSDKFVYMFKNVFTKYILTENYLNTVNSTL